MFKRNPEIYSDELTKPTQDLLQKLDFSKNKSGGINWISIIEKKGRWPKFLIVPAQHYVALLYIFYGIDTDTSAFKLFNKGRECFEFSVGDADILLDAIWELIEKYNIDENIS